MITTINNAEIIKKYKDKIDKIKHKLKDLSKPLSDFEMYYSGIIRKNYYSDGEIFTHGGGWAPLSEEYLEWKRAMVGKQLSYGRKVVSVEKLRLMDTLRKEVFSKNAVTIKKDRLEYNLKTIYAKIHQVGGRTSKGKIPARPYLYSNKAKGLRSQDITVYFKILEKYLLSEIMNEQSIKA
ncbi:MAG: hypothetical protein GYA14_13830 [Ignavibacteria bacterium]|nr:hypothetical protein [Ignavibacteria bacterium]